MSEPAETDAAQAFCLHCMGTGRACFAPPASASLPVPHAASAPASEYLLAPPEPSAKMINAAINARIHLNITRQGWTMAYRAMIAAANPPHQPARTEE